MHLSIAATALAALASVSSAQMYNNVPLSGNHSAATAPFWNNYTYCQGRIIQNGKGWSPMQNATLVKLQVMHRHGARTPGAWIPSDSTVWNDCGNPDEFVFQSNKSANQGRILPLKEQTVINGPFQYAIWKGNCDLGQLTQVGALRMQAVGSRLREIYVDMLGFLPKFVDPSFQISHTYIWRTRESVENLFVGMYPTQYRNGSTLTMHVRPQSIEVLLANTATCPKLASLTAAYAASPEYAAVIKPYAALNAQLLQAYNLTSNSTLASSAPDTLTATYCNGKGLKPNFTAADAQAAIIFGTASYHGTFRNAANGTAAKTLGVGPWLVEILASFQDRSTRLQVYSAHDASLDMFLAVVADPDLPWPPFSAQVEIELWQHATKGPLVRMYYEGMIVPAHSELQCDFSGCPLGTLTAFMNRYVPANLMQACAAS